MRKDFTLEHPHFFTKKEWAKAMYKDTILDCPRAELEAMFPDKWIGTHCYMIAGPALVFEGLHFFIEGHGPCYQHGNDA